MNRTNISAAIVLIIALLTAWLIWEWGFCRFYVQPGYMAVVTSKAGAPLEKGQILAKDGQKGVQEEVLGEGRYFRNPIMFKWEFHKVLAIPPGKIGIVTSRVGKQLPEGEFLANPGEMGIWKKVLGPGTYRMNPYGYKVDIVSAISIPVGYAGVVTSLSGPQAEGGTFATRDQKGVLRDILQPGLYFINPKQYKVDIIEVGINQISLLGKQTDRAGETSSINTKKQLETKNQFVDELQSTAIQEQKRSRWGYTLSNLQQMSSSSDWEYQGRSGKAAPQQQQMQKMDLKKAEREYMEGAAQATLFLPQFVEFPSRDGFHIVLDMTVEVELLPADVSWLLNRYGDLPKIVDNIIMPQINSIARNKGSEYGAKDFIMGEGREKFQNELTKSLQSTLAQKKVIVHNALIRHVEVPSTILEPIQQTAVAIEQNLTNKEKQNTARKMADLNTEQTLIEQRRQEVTQQTEKLKAEIKADQEKTVASIAADAIKQVADIARETAKIKADTRRVLAEAQATATKLAEGEKANGLKMKTKAFGDPSAYAMKELSESLNPKVKINILHTGEGTLWTDMEKARSGELGGAVILRDQNKAAK
jgi:hypothetical protein